MSLEKILSTYISAYERKVNELYKHVAEHEREVFPLLRAKNNLNIAHLEINKDVFGDTDCYLIFDNLPEHQGTYDFKELGSTDLGVLMDLDVYDRLEKLLDIKLPEIKNSRILKDLSFSFDIYDTKGSLDTRFVTSTAKYEVEKDYTNWRSINKTKVSNFNHDKISPYSHLDYEGLLKKFSSEKFEKDFAYQMDQAEECYSRHFYLPAAATLSVALETILADLCQKNKIKIRNQTEMNHLADRLVEKGVINYRLGRRIDITYSLRNSIAHTNNGEVSKDDCSIILSCIRTLIDEHY